MCRDASPFADDTSLGNITSGVAAHKSVDADDAHKVGEHVVQFMIDANMWEYTFCRKQQVVTMAVSNKVITNNEAGQIDAHLLFQRLTFISTAKDALNEDLFRYELRAYPPALFDTSMLPRLADKASLAKAIWSLVRETQVTVVIDAQFVIDDGA